MTENWALRVIAESLTESAPALRPIGAVAEVCRIRVLLAPWYREDEKRRRRVLRAWRFPDLSHIVLVPSGEYPSAIEVLPQYGVSLHLMRDTAEAVRHLLRLPRVPAMETMVALFVELHGGLPRLDVADAVHALQAENRIVRMAAIAALRVGGCRPTS